MYDLPYYKEQNLSVVKAFMLEHPFAFLTGCNGKKRPVATQVPVFVEERNGKSYLTGHIMRNTDHHKAFVENKNVLAVFTGPSTYVSATWYVNEHTASTWNFMSVYVRGLLRFVDEAQLAFILSKLSLHFEKGDEESPTVFENLPADFKEKAMKMIVGFEIEIESIENVFKLSQDRNKDSYLKIIEELKKLGPNQRYIATEMEKRMAKVFD